MVYPDDLKVTVNIINSDDDCDESCSGIPSISSEIKIEKEETIKVKKVLNFENKIINFNLVDYKFYLKAIKDNENNDYYIINVNK